MRYAAFPAAVMAAGLSVSEARADIIQECNNGNGEHRIAACTTILNLKRYRPAEYPDVIGKRAQGYIEAGRWDDAIRGLDEFLRFRTSNALAYAYRSFAHEKSGNIERARADMRFAHEYDRRNPVFPLELGRLNLLALEYMAAIEMLTLAVSMNDEMRAYELRAYAFVQLGDTNAAIADYSTLIAKEPRSGKYLDARTHLFEKLGKFEEANGDYARLIELSPNRGDFYFRRGLNWSELRRFQDALDDYSKAIELTPGRHYFHYARARSLQALWRFAEAERDHTEAIRLQPTFALAWNDRGEVRVRLQRIPEALRDFQKALEIDPKYARAKENIEFVKLLPQLPGLMPSLQFPVPAPITIPDRPRPMITEEQIKRHLETPVQLAPK